MDDRKIVYFRGNPRLTCPQPAVPHPRLELPEIVCEPVSTIELEYNFPVAFCSSRPIIIILPQRGGVVCIRSSNRYRRGSDRRQASILHIHSGASCRERRRRAFFLDDDPTGPSNLRCEAFHLASALDALERNSFVERQRPKHGSGRPRRVASSLTNINEHSANGCWLRRTTTISNRTTKCGSAKPAGPFGSPGTDHA
jgi:hypothetical protein